MSMQLSINEGKYGIKLYKLEDFQKDIIGFGRQSDSDIVMNSSFVSRLHGCIFKENGSWYIKDLDSSYGLLYNKNRIEEMRLNGGEHIIIMSPSGEYVELIFDAYNDNSIIPINYSASNGLYSEQNKKNVNRVVFIITSIMLWLLLIGTYFLPWSTISSSTDIFFLDNILKRNNVPVALVFGPNHYSDLIWVFLFILPFIALHVACFYEYRYIVLGIIVSALNLVFTIFCVAMFSTPLLYLVDNGDYEDEFEKEVIKRIFESFLSPRIGCFLAVLLSLALFVITIVFLVLMLKENKKDIKSGTLRALKFIGICILVVIALGVISSVVKTLIFKIRYR